MSMDSQQKHDTHSQSHTDELNQPTMSRGEYKVPGGKLVAVQVEYQGDALSNLSLDGDFFIDGVDDPSLVVSALEKLLMNNPSSVEEAVAEVCREFPEVQLVGLTADAIESALSRALSSSLAFSISSPSLSSPSAASASSSSSNAEPRTQEGKPPVQSFEEVTCLSPAWDNLDVILLDDEMPRSPAEHMALDEILAREVADGKRAAALRFWQWGSNAAIIGLHQSVTNEVDEKRARELGFTVVRRMTGGGAMFVEPGNTITYSLYVPAHFLDGVTGYEAYKRCDEWALKALNNLGIDARYKPINDITSPTAGKIGGAAQRRFRASYDSHGTGCVLHHVTMAYDIDAAKMVEVLRISREKMADKAVKSAVKRVDPLKSRTTLSRDELYRAMKQQALDIIPHIHETSLNDEISTLDAARDLADRKYASDEWTRIIE